MQFYLPKKKYIYCIRGYIRCWWHCAGGIVLVALCWWHCAGGIVRGCCSCCRECFAMPMLMELDGAKARYFKGLWGKMYSEEVI